MYVNLVSFLHEYIELRGGVKRLLLNTDIGIKELIFLPFLLKAQSEKFIWVNFTLEVYKRMFFKIKSTSFKRQEIKEPETYPNLLQKAIIKIKINKSPKSLLLKL